MEAKIDQNFQKALTAIHDAQTLLICAGAGMSVESGLPDYRGDAGFWRAYPQLQKLGVTFQEALNPVWFKKNPHLIWGFYGFQYRLYNRTKPHEGYAKLLELVRRKKDYFIFTSNVDGHFQKAGFDPNKIVECHGSIHRTQCSKRCNDAIYNSQEALVSLRIEEKRLFAHKPLPKCPHCGALLRPNILMFGDSAYVDRITKEQTKRLDAFLDRAKDLAIIEIGAGTAVRTVRDFSEKTAKRRRIPIIRINPYDFAGSQEALAIKAGALNTLLALHQTLF